MLVQSEYAENYDAILEMKRIASLGINPHSRQAQRDMHSYIDWMCDALAWDIDELEIDKADFIERLKAKFNEQS